MIALNAPLKPNLKKLNQYLEMINRNGWYTNFGPLHDELKFRLEEYLGVKNLLLVNNGTTALQVAGRALESDSFISTPFSFVATVSAFKWQKDLVAFADIERGSYNLSVSSVQEAFDAGCQADTVLATHVYGNPCDVEAFDALAKRENKTVIYDAAHAFAVKCNKQSVLNYGDASTLSFHATKVFHTIEGGAIVFKSSEHYEKAKEQINFGIKKGHGIQDVGINAKMSEYHAAVGLVNLDEIDNVLEHRAEIFDYYRKSLKDFVEVPVWHSNATYNGAYMPIKLRDTKQILKVKSALMENNIESRNYFSPSLEQTFDENSCYGVKNSSEVSSSVLSLPMHAYLSMGDTKKVISIIKRLLLND